MDGDDVIDCTPLLALFARAVNLHREDLGRQLYYNPVPPRNTYNVHYGDTYNFYINDTRPLARAVNLHREDLGRQLYYNPVPPRNTYNVHYGDTYNFYINDTRPQYIRDCLSCFQTILDGNRGSGQRSLQQADASSEILRGSGAKCRACSKIAAFSIYGCGHDICEACGLRLKSQNWPCPVVTCREPVLDIVKLNRY
uniref:Uncharacterized protein LOC111136282 isoform X2 n=1 Tax=Crassostrea virginica TaxID=6565 RepID=A0A8B8ES43_CRAVI|nr:uncharacterized protein LOC111136282 isoform X2 [Crassostrea virginica]XP_022342738.1 uncharacterized protein LOC111136282 isoform X2 [Crassostrea virginica]